MARRSKGFVVDKETGIVTGQRKLVDIGGTLYVALPKEFVERHNLKAGKKIAVVGSSVLKLIPIREVG